MQALVKVLLNVEGCVVVGGCVLAVDLLTVVHENSERTPIPLQSNLIAATAFMEPPKEWMYIDKGGAEVGPVEKDVIRSLWSKKDIDWTTKCRALGMSDWKKLRDIRELRWAVAVRVPVLTPSQVKLYGLFYVCDWLWKFHFIMLNFPEDICFSCPLPFSSVLFLHFYAILILIDKILRR